MDASVWQMHFYSYNKKQIDRHQDKVKCNVKTDGSEDMGKCMAGVPSGCCWMDVFSAALVRWGRGWHHGSALFSVFQKSEAAAGRRGYRDVSVEVFWQKI